MIKTEIIEINGLQLKRTFSDARFLIQKKGTDEKYSDAVDVLDSSFEYDETDIEIEGEDEALFVDAPKDGKDYIRKNSEWVELD